MIDFKTLKSTARIEDLARLFGGVPDRRGMCRCVLHDDKTPSMKIDAEKQLFYCFGCGAGGDIITLAQLHEGLSAPEAARFIDCALGLGLDRDISDAERRDTMLRAKKRHYWEMLKRDEEAEKQKRLYSELCGEMHRLREAMNAEPPNDKKAELAEKLNRVEYLINLIEINCFGGENNDR